MRKLWAIAILLFVVIGVLIYFNPGQFFTKAALKVIGEYNPPEFESTASILDKVRTKNVYYDRLYRLASLQSLKDFKTKEILEIPFVHIYNNKRQALTRASGDECKWSLMKFFNNEDSSSISTGDTIMYDYIMDRLEPVDLRTSSDTFDYYMLAGWANYAPKLSDSLFFTTNRIKETFGNKICLSYINLDFQQEWEAEIDSIQKAKNQ